jgi:F1F0 ATPase subunit 2
MNEWVWAAGMFVAGGLLAAVWLLGLWRDVRRLAGRPHGGRRLVAGALLRLFIVAAGFYLIITAAPHWLNVAAALLGFMVVRFAVLRSMHPGGNAGEEAP